MDRFKHYFLGKEFILATDHKALTSALGENKSNETYQSRLTRWVDRLLFYQFKVVHIPGKDMGIVDYLSRDPIGEPWLESELDEKFVVASIDQFHAALDCLNSRLVDTNNFISNENILEHSDRRSTLDKISNTSSPGCYSNLFVQNQTELDRNENDQNTLNKISHFIQLVEIDKKEKQRKIATKQEEKLKEEPMEKKLKKTVKLEKTEGKRNQMLEQITETTFHRTRTVQMGTTGHESDASDWYMPQVEWKKVTPTSWKDKYHQTLSKEAPQKLWSFWDLVGSEQTDNIRPENMLQLEAS